MPPVPNTPRTAIVTGGAGPGIGHGLSEVLASEGWNLVITDRDADRGHSFTEKLKSRGSRAVLVQADVTAPDAPEKTVRTAMTEFGRLDGLVNNVGVGLTKKAGDVSDEEFFQLFNVDFLASFRFVRAALPELKRTAGSIVNIGSVHALGGVPNYSLYSATKAALEAFTRGVAVDYGPEGVRANTVHPGLVDSPQNEPLLANVVKDPRAWLDNFSKERQCLPQLASAHDVGELVAFLLGKKSGSITGQAFVIDAGTSAQLWNRER